MISINAHYNGHKVPVFPTHTGDNIVEKLKEVVSEYDTDDSSIFAIVHDQGSNFQQVGYMSFRR